PCRLPSPTAGFLRSYRVRRQPELSPSRRAAEESGCRRWTRGSAVGGEGGGGAGDQGADGVDDSDDGERRAEHVEADEDLGQAGEVLDVADETLQQRDREQPAPGPERRGVALAAGEQQADDDEDDE